MALSSLGETTTIASATSLSPNSGFVAVAAGYYHSLGLKADGSIVAWGLNDYGQCNIPEPNSGFIAVAAGDYHSLGLKADGSIVAWGLNDKGQCNLPSPNSSFIAISAGYQHSLGLKQDGSIVGWGSNTDYYGKWIGQATPPEGNDLSPSKQAELIRSLLNRMAPS